MSLAALLTECAHLAAGGGTGALASVVRRRGSLPMSATAKLLVTADGARFGTIGGGCLEAEVIERALDVCKHRVPVCTQHSLNAELAGDYGLTCGGTADLFIEPVVPDAMLSALYAEAAAVVARGDRAVLATARSWPDGRPRKLLVTALHRIGLDGDILLCDAIADYEAERETPLFDDEVVVEALVGAPRVVVFGAGHVGARISEAAKFAGWRVTIVDDRAEFADDQQLPWADEVLLCDFGDVHAAAVTPADFVVICTRGHQHDALIAAQVAPVFPRFLGMLGSRRKGALTAQALRGWGVDEDAIARIVCPVGMDVGADTPAEIAVSVVAQLVAIRRQAAGGSTQRADSDADAVGEPSGRT